MSTVYLLAGQNVSSNIYVDREADADAHHHPKFTCDHVLHRQCLVVEPESPRHRKPEVWNLLFYLFELSWQHFSNFERALWLRRTDGGLGLLILEC